MSVFFTIILLLNLRGDFDLSLVDCWKINCITPPTVGDIKVEKLILHWQSLHCSSLYYMSLIMNTISQYCIINWTNHYAVKLFADKCRSKCHWQQIHSNIYFIKATRLDQRWKVVLFTFFIITLLYCPCY